MFKKALILIDFENEWIDKNSEYYVGDIGGVIDRVNNLIDYCRQNGYKIVFTRHVEEESDGAFALDSANTEIIADLDKKNSDILITKHKISPYYETSMKEELLGIDSIVVAGILTNLCVRSMVHDAYDRDLDIRLIKDCCVSFDKKTQEFTFQDLKATRPEIDFRDLSEFIKN